MNSNAFRLEVPNMLPLPNQRSPALSFLCFPEIPEAIWKLAHLLKASGGYSQLGSKEVNIWITTLIVHPFPYPFQGVEVSLLQLLQHWTPPAAPAPTKPTKNLDETPHITQLTPTSPATHVKSSFQPAFPYKSKYLLRSYGVFRLSSF